MSIVRMMRIKQKSRLLPAGGSKNTLVLLSFVIDFFYQFAVFKVKGQRPHRSDQEEPAIL